MLGASRAASTREYQLLDTGTITSTGSQSYTIPDGVLYLEIEIWGGGGGGGLGLTDSGRGGTTYQAGGGGGGAGYVKHKYYGAQDMRADDTLNFTIGAGGAGADLAGSNENTGTDGGDTTIDTHKRLSATITTFSSVKAYGGMGGLSAGGFCIGDTCGDGGTATNGNVTNSNGKGGVAQPSSSGTCMAGVDGGDSGATDGTGGDGGNILTGDASDGDAPGGGGGSGAGCCSSCSHIEVGGDGGDGGDGKVIVKAYG